MEIQYALKEQRLEAGFTLQYVEKHTGISNQNLSRWENGKAVPGVDFCITLAKFYGCSLDELLGRENEFNEQTAETPTQPRDEMLLLQAYRAMSPGKKRALFNMLDLDEDIIQHNKKTS